MLAKPNPCTPADHPTAVVTPLKCPRCDSANTKFCYYNNYSLSQPRHFCKSCKRYWTRGGTLRNVPVGGGSRKNKRSKKHNRSSISPAVIPSIPPPPTISPTDLPSLFYNSPVINSANVFLPKLDVDFSSFEGNNSHSRLGASLADLQKSAFHGHYSLLSSQLLHSEGYQSLFSYDAIPVDDNSLKRAIQWQAIKESPMEPVPAASAGAAVADSPYFYWNQSESGGWPAPGSSMAPLF